MAKSARKPLPSACIACGKELPAEARLPFCADVHVLDDELVVTCSSACRQRLGLRERKVAVTGMEAVKT